MPSLDCRPYVKMAWRRRALLLVEHVFPPRHFDTLQVGQNDVPVAFSTSNVPLLEGGLYKASKETYGAGRKPTKNKEFSGQRTSDYRPGV